MPTYEYECMHCAHKFEVFQKITDKHLDKCPKCNHKVRRLIGSGAGIFFSRKYSQRTESGSRCCHWESVASGKGSGFYATDYRKIPKTEPAETQASTCPQAKVGCNACNQK